MAYNHKFEIYGFALVRDCSMYEHSGTEASMVSVLCIGQYNREGKFVKRQWESFIEWCKVECNKIVVYSHMTYDIIRVKFLLYCNICLLKKPDETLDVYAYEIEIINNIFWDYIKNYNYNIDCTDDISHIYFFCDKKYIASLEIVDYENHLVIEELATYKKKLLLDKKLVQENIESCFKEKADIDAILQGENWKPLGEV